MQGQDLPTEKELGAPSATALDLLVVSLELIEEPAFLVNGRGSVVMANRRGRARLEEDRTLLADCFDAVATRAPSARVRIVHPVATVGEGSHHVVVVERGDASLASRLERFRVAHGLTAAESRVLARIVHGDTNKGIALTLGCAARTVEVHATALMRKLGVDSRARLVAAFWRP
ncbi:MAG: Transcriptional regulator, LuxR family [Labilithrix sp.]|nr:Transcriptional regulator, LuxR family [Labilithrix sp.]